MDKIRVYLVCDHFILRRALNELVTAQPDMEVVGEGTAEEMLPGIGSYSPEVVITDVLWPGRRGAGVVKQIREVCPGTRILLMMLTDDTLLIRKILEGGATGCVGRHATDADVLTAIRQLHQQQIYIDPELAGSVVQEVLGFRCSIHAGHKGNSPKQLSARELEVLEYLVKGYTNQQVADSLFLSVKTTETYRARLKRKLGLRNRADIIRYGVEMGMLLSSDSGNVA